MVRTLLFISFILFSIVAFTGIDSASAQLWDPPKVSVFPNPTSDFFGISHTEGISKLTIYNLVGKEMRAFKAEEGIKYNVGDLPNGMYLIQMTNNDKKVVNTQRLHKR